MGDLSSTYLVFDAPDSVIICVADVMFARALEDNERRGMKENFRTFVQFRSGRVHYLYMDFLEFLDRFAKAAHSISGVEVRES